SYPPRQADASAGCPALVQPRSTGCLNGPRYGLLRDAVPIGPPLQRPWRGVDVAVITEQLSRDGIGLGEHARVGILQVDLLLHPSIGIPIHQDLRSAIAQIRRRGVEDPVLGEEDIRGIELQVAYLEVDRVHVPLRT